MQWICNDCHKLFIWIRKGRETRPICPYCGSSNVDVREV